MIKGTNVYLTEPFPLDSWESLYEWLNACSIISLTDHFPKDRGQFHTSIAESLQGMRSWAVHTRDGKLIGAIIFEPVGTMGGKTYVVSRRAVWGKGFMDEAGVLVLKELFEPNQLLQYIIGMVLANNAPSKSYCERLGFSVKNVLTDYTIQCGRLRDLVVYELTRQQWKAQRRPAS